ncbi:MAG: hypothetical protein LVR00_00020 [Rhabdochlamydiaceae bacterium]
MKIVHKCITTRQGDLATKIKNYISALQEAELKVARAQREAARARGETNLTPHDTRIRKLENQPTATKAVLKNLDKLIRSGFKSFLKYQEMLTSSDTIAAAQEEFIETYRRAKLFENAERTGGIESTDEYRQALQANPEIAQNPNGFKNECLARHTSEQTRVKNNFARALGNAVRKKLNIGSRLLNQVAGSRLSNLVLPHLDTLPEINELEYILTGCRLTNPVDASISRELISIHLQHFLAISAAPIVSEAAVAVAREVTRQAPTEAEPLDRNTDLELIEGLLKLTLNHYSRSLPNSTIIGMVDKALPFIFTSLREGIKSAISEWYTRNQEPVIVEHEEIEDDDFFDAVEQLEPTNPEIPEDDGVGAEEIDAGWVEILTNEEDDDFFDAVEQLEPTNPEIPEDDGVGAEEIDAGWVEILTNKEDDDIAFPSQEEIDEAAPAQPAEPSEEDDGLGRSLPIEALDDIDFLTQEEIDEAVRATPAQPANSSKAGKLFRKFFKN